MTVKIGMVIASHLSDAELEFAAKHLPLLQAQVLERIRFVKYLIHFHKDLNEEVTDEYLDEMWKKAKKQ
jgi:hypothetical protein